jgi:hypothetical protein
MTILGINFLRAFKLCVDPAAGKLVQDGTGLTVLRNLDSKSNRRNNFSLLLFFEKVL